MGYPHAATHASGTVWKPGASCYDFWFPVSCEKYSPPLSDTNTLMNSTAHLTPNTAGLGSAAETPHSTSISLSVCAYNPGLTFMLLMIQWRAVSFWHYSYYSSFSHRCGQCSALCEIYCITVRKSSRSKVTRTDVVPPFLPTFNLFLFLVYISSFHMPRRKMYKCRGTTETAITAVCAHVWTCAPPPPPPPPPPHKKKKKKKGCQ